MLNLSLTLLRLVSSKHSYTSLTLTETIIITMKIMLYISKMNINSHIAPNIIHNQKCFVKDFFKKTFYYK